MAWKELPDADAITDYSSRIDRETYEHCWHMVEYRRPEIAGGTYFFTANCAERRDIHTLTNNIEALRRSFREVKSSWPFSIDAIVVLPEDLHCI